MENYNQHMIDQLVKVIPQDVLQKLQQLSAQDFNAVLQSVKQQNPTEKQLDQSTLPTCLEVSWSLHRWATIRQNVNSSDQQVAIHNCLFKIVCLK